MKLYELTDEIRALEAMADDPDVPAQAIADTLEALKMEANDKATAVAMIATEKAAMVDAIDGRIKALQDRKKAIQNADRQLRDYLAQNMAATGVKRIQGADMDISLVKGRESVVIDDQDALPDEMLRVKTDIAPDRKAIGDALKNGDAVPGAHLETGKPSVRIK